MIITLMPRTQKLYLVMRTMIISTVLMSTILKIMITTMRARMMKGYKTEGKIKALMKKKI